MISARFATTAGCTVVLAAIVAMGVPRAQQSAGTATPRLPPPPRRGPAPPTVPVSDDAFARGKSIFQQQCALCHGPEGRGNGPAAASLSARPSDQTNVRAMDTLTDVDIARRIQSGGFEMPSFTTIRGDDLIGLVAYVRSQSRGRPHVVELHGLSQGEVKDFVPVTGEMLAHPAPEDWPLFRRTHDGWAYSPLDQITRANVGSLRLVWARAMEPGGMYSTPLVYRGTMYLAHPGDVIEALDAATGDLIWQFRWVPPPSAKGGTTPAPDGENAAPRRERLRSVVNIAIFGDRIFHYTRDQHLIAVDARSGSLVWSVAEAGRGIGHMAGPIIAGGKVISGRSCAATGGPEACYIAANDVDDGHEVWRLRTIPRPGEPGDDSWKGLPYEKRVHVGAWGVGSYDPALNLIFWGTSVPAPSLERLRGTVGGDVLFSNSTLAIDAATGALKWHYQHLPRDNWDFDHVFERILVDVATTPDPASVRWINPKLQPGERREVVTGIPGKTGIIFTLDRRTGEFLWARETITQTVIRDIDPATGRVTIDDRMVTDPYVEMLVCPSLGGGKDWPAGAYSPRTRVMYQPQQNMCMLLTGNTDRPTPADGYATSWVMVADPKARPDMVGRIDAVSIETGRTAWLHEQRAGILGSLVAVAGGLVFGGDVNRRFMAFDDETGAVRWEAILSGPVSGHAVSYGVGGRQFIAVPAGGDTASPEKRVMSLHPEIRVPQGQNAIFVFGLPQEAAETSAAGPAVRGVWTWAALAGVVGLGVGLLARRRGPKR